MSETLLSILTAETWSWDPDEFNQIAFNKDGTGIVHPTYIPQPNIRLDCRRIRVEAQKSRTPQSTHRPTHKPTQRPSILAQFNIEMTLTTRRPTTLGDSINRRVINEQLLTDAAFLPKEYTATLEAGRFLCASDVGGGYSDSPRYGARLSFDKSPYPPREEWKEAGGGVDVNRFWEWREFCSRRLPEKTGLFSWVWGSLEG
ncbi:hypothetical protein ANOM_001099 [Aspergillus nomiae NRRL 13137]|uniref:Uncharacterized protein n=1 Tax=Aspergillus nomiae NRRL (strain ATCC 15546 / NRRL 13137 / CBS 260.88 / M93) TaxID=1509407 RepID=A0A0L1JFY6_ASPN3|nr:uncharacterized protein ANOM_001099 [Aspergillus nomiae NRRL 13137]KNG90685.1 hypothetical protein ANOM_001099 [Aspergillus nomiae NRRL 13137]